jgi:pimeloyl-ACP methyl ester carboxylesterase
MVRALMLLVGAMSTSASCHHTPPDPVPTKIPVLRVTSKDGTPIAFECIGSGPSLVMVHGGIGDRTRWTPMSPLLSPRFTVCAMDRRGHGASGDSREYGLQKEGEDIAAVVESRPPPVYVLGHSYGGVAALEATNQTSKIAKLVLYEPPIEDHIQAGVVERIEQLIQAGDRDAAVATFLREVVKLSDREIESMRTGPGWNGYVRGIDAHPRQMRALMGYHFDAQRSKASVKMPTLLLTGSETGSPDLKQAIKTLEASLPQATVVVLQGQQHNAMDTGRQMLADAVTTFLLGP